MDPTSDFVVVDDDSGPQKALMDRLGVLVDLFSKALDAVNHSNVLLKDQLRSALTITLHNFQPDMSISTEALVNALESSVTSTEDVRAGYMRNLCSRLVAENERNETLSAELSTLEQSMISKDKDREEQLKTASATLEKIYEVLRPYNPQESPESACTGAIGLRSLDELNEALNDINNRIVTLHLTVKNLQDTKVNEPKPVEQFAQTSTSMIIERHTTDPLRVEIGSQTDNLSPTVPTRPRQEPPQSPTCASPVVADRSGPFEFHAQSDNPPPVPPQQTQPEPAFSVDEEEPVCPCCNYLCDSRVELESHLLNCLK